MNTVEKCIQEQVVSGDIEALKALVSEIEQVFARENLTASELQWKVMINHFDAVIARQLSGEKLPEMDSSLFADLSEQSMQLAREVAGSIKDIDESEIFLIAVHVENVLGNIN
ncbi:hypothetical protein AALM99_06375 [Lactococcus muris]|uniref:PRD domain-containing protein n=1 Tax=Lactococcus muris TaxID=2941330 RepID=A0ABV4D8P4_9LACT